MTKRKLCISLIRKLELLNWKKNCILKFALNDSYTCKLESEFTKITKMMPPLNIVISNKYYSL